MKILMLTWEYPPRIVGGIARVVNDLSKRLIKDGHDVTLLHIGKEAHHIMKMIKVFMCIE